MEITNIAAEIFNNEDSLISTKIDEIKLVRDNVDELEILIRISGFSQKSRFSKISLLFKDIIEFGFYFNESYTFYNIENYKLLNLNNCIYVSFDPDDNIGKSENDSDFIFAKHVELSTEI